MEQDLFKSLPSEILTNILSRLPLRDIGSSKCVCKPWLDSLEKDELVKSHLSRSTAALAVLLPEKNSSRCLVFELADDEIDGHDHRYNHLANFGFPHRATIEGSANGLLFLINFDALYLWNPISREYIELHRPEEFVIPIEMQVIYGFGVSKISGQHKVVRIIPQSDDLCHVYTLGTGSWRRVEAVNASFRIRHGTFVNGNLHWLVSDSNRNSWSSCFDLETECFSTFSVPPRQEIMGFMEGLSALRDCLCVCDRTSNEIVLWLMKEYGDEKSWTKEYVINIVPDFDRDNYAYYAYVYPIKVFNDGDVLMLWDGRFLFYYSNETKTAQKTGFFDAAGNAYITSMLLTPSFLTLKSFPMENVISF